MTDLTARDATFATLDCRFLVVPASAADPALAAALPAELLASQGFTGKAGQVVRLPRAALGFPLAAETLVLAAVEDATSPESVRRAVGAAVRTLDGVDTVGVAILPDAAGAGLAAEVALVAAAQGAALGGGASMEVIVACPGGASKQLAGALHRAEVVADAVHLTRELTNEPPNRLYPKSFAKKAAALAAAGGVKAEVLDRAALAKGGYGGILAVGQGSVHAPRLVKLTYSPVRAKPKVALVGKGITFDSGGLSLKRPSSMETMKSDMAGAAAVLAVLLAAAKLKLPVKLTGYLCLAENMPSGAAQRPSDVITVKDGHTIEVVNTDAEGRLVLADGLAAAIEAGVDQVIDIATLTGAQIVSLGSRMAGVMGTDSVRDSLVTAAQTAGELAWPMPLPDYLLEKLSSQVADLANANLSGPDAGMLSAGLFLKQFVGDTPWAHIDIAGPSFNTGEAFGYTPKGGTGYGVRLLVQYLESLAG
ncbi:MAG: leucyl aminopeptidase [Bifidobacteriaceae bacterium]|nr:leucyl aminopeptidase [Bifidobacteriaceae bacterium]